MKNFILLKSEPTFGLSDRFLFGVITHISLNYYEFDCIRRILLGVSKGMRKNLLPKSLIEIGLNYIKVQLRYLNDWLNKPTLEARLHLDGSNIVLWPFTSSELVDWLLPICQLYVDDTRSFEANRRVAHQAILVDKLAKIQQQGYPLYPIFSVSN